MTDDLKVGDLVKWRYYDSQIGLIIRVSRNLYSNRLRFMVYWVDHTTYFYSESELVKISP